MARYNTGNPVPSNEVKDFSDNAQIVDLLVHSKNPYDKDRFSIDIITWNGLQLMVADAAKNYGYMIIYGKSFTTGATVNLNQVLLDETIGEYFKWTGPFPDGGKVVPPNSSPENTGGIGIGAWIGVGDSSLRADLKEDADTSGDALITVKQPIAGSIARTQHEKNAETISVKDMGAKGDGINDDAAAINSAVAGGNKTVIFPPGKYLMKSHARLYKNTKLIFDAGAELLNDNQTTEYLFVNGEYGNANYATAYNGEGNIVVIGGRFDNGKRAARKLGTNAFGIAHAENITFKDCVFANNYKSHFIEINSSKNVLIENCLFTDLNPDNEPGSRECINIDFASSSGFPPFGSYDGTVCEDVLIRGCIFRNGDVSAGSHSINTPDNLHKRIRMVDCHIENMISSGSSLRFSEDSGSEGCTFKECGDRVYRPWGAKRHTIHNCTFIGGGSVGVVIMDSNAAVNGVDVLPSRFIVSDCNFIDSKGVAISQFKGENLLVSNCRIESSTPAFSIRQTSNASDIVITNCSIRRPGSNSAAITIAGSGASVSNCRIMGGGYTYGVDFQGSSKNNWASNNFIEQGTLGLYRTAGSGINIDGVSYFLVKDDGFIEIDITTPSYQGLFLISANVGAVNDNNINGMFYIRATDDSTEWEIYKVSAVGATLNLLTGPLTGTTGPDGTISLSVVARKLLIENRFGYDRNFSVRLLTV